MPRTCVLMLAHCFCCSWLDRFSYYFDGNKSSCNRAPQPRASVLPDSLFLSTIPRLVDDILEAFCPATLFSVDLRRPFTPRDKVNSLSLSLTVSRRFPLPARDLIGFLSLAKVLPRIQDGRSLTISPDRNTMANLMAEIFRASWRVLHRKTERKPHFLCVSRFTAVSFAFHCSFIQPPRVSPSRSFFTGTGEEEGGCFLASG